MVEIAEANDTRKSWFLMTTSVSHTSTPAASADNRRRAIALDELTDGLTKMQRGMDGIQKLIDYMKARAEARKVLASALINSLAVTTK